MNHSDGTQDFELLGLDPLPDGWKYMPLGELVDSTRGISYGIVQPGSYVQNGTPIVRVNNLKNGRIIVDDILKISQTIEEKYQRTRLRGGEVLLSLVGSLGQTSVVPKELRGWNVARAVAVIPVLSEINPEWVNYALRSPQSQHYIWTWATTTVQATLNLGDVVRLPIPIPSEKERQTIIEILGALDDKIELNRRMNQTLESMARAVFRSWFVENEEVGDWEKSSLEEIFGKKSNCVLTGPFGSHLHAHDYRDEGTPLILVKHVMDGHILEDGLPLVGEHKLSEMNRYLLEVGDIVFTRVGAVGRSAYVHPRNKGWMISGQTLRVRVPDKTKLNPRYLAQIYLEPSFIDMVEQHALGTTRPSLNTTILSSFKFVCGIVCCRS